MNIYTIQTGNFKLDGGAMFGVVPKTIWAKLNPPDSNNLCTWAMRCLLVQDGGRLLLIDTGIGNKQDDTFFSHYHLHGNHTLVASLAQHGFHPSDITDVLLTHLHFDHCGGSIQRQGDKLIPVFENAIYWSNQPHWQWATQPNQREKASFLANNILPIEQSGQLRFLEPANQKDDPFTSYQSPFQNISILAANGHTHAMMIPHIHYRNQTIVFMADLLPSIAHIPLPYVMAYDMFPLTTLAEKKAILHTAANNNHILFFEHDPTHECCTVALTDKGIKANATFLLSEI